jgi:hypothetical protein
MIRRFSGLSEIAPGPNLFHYDPTFGNDAKDESRTEEFKIKGEFRRGARCGAERLIQLQKSFSARNN